MLDVWARVRSNSPAFLRHFDDQYRRFQPTHDRSGDSGTLEYEIDAHPLPCPQHLRLRLDRDCWELPFSAALLTGYLQEAVVAHLLERVRDFFVLHAGAVARGGQAAVLVADSGHGKTTLVLELVKHGWDFLSDDIAAVRRQDAHVHPFPRALHVRGKATRSQSAGSPAVAPGPDAGRRVLDLEELYPGQVGAPAALGCVVFLRNPEPDPAPQAVKCAAIVVDHLDMGLVESIHSVPGVADVTPAVQDGLPVLRLGLRDVPGALEHAVARCREQRHFVLAVLKPQPPWPRFDGPARLRPIAPATAARHLLPHLLTGTHSALLEEGFGGRPTHLFRGLAGLLRSVPCYDLDVGPLGDMADLVTEAASGRGLAPPLPGTA